MLMLSSSSTSPRSSRPTMLSSSLSAFSNDMSLMSRCFAAGLAMSLFIMLPLQLVATGEDSIAGVHQRPDMHTDRPRQCGEVVAAFEHGHQPALGVSCGDLRDLVGGPGEIGFEQPQVGEWI